MAKLFEPPRYIAIEGPIRAGKSTLAAVIGEKLRARRIEEPEDNPFLEKFYAGEPGSAFAAQMDFLVKRFEQLRTVNTAGRETVVADYIFEKDKLFACLNLNDAELSVYNRYYENFRKQLGTPDLVIYLQANAEALTKRVRRKNAPEEQEISSAYIDEVIRAYEHYFFHYSSSDLLVVNTSEIDFVEHNEDLNELLRRLDEPIKGSQYFLPLAHNAETRAERARA
ncbi:MAG: deoxynucleoside kinase [Acidobacteriaceae bacterium]